MAITRINEFLAVEGQSEALFSFLSSIVPYISSSEGNVSCEVLCDTEDQHRIVVLEKWDSIDSHKKSVDNFPKDKMQAVMGFFAAPPKGSYFRA